MIAIRRATDADIPALAVLQREGWERDYVGYAPAGVADISLAQYGTEAALAEQLRTFDIYDVAVVDGDVVGCICGLVAYDGGPEILWLHVDRSARRTGLGRTLVGYFIEQLPAGADRVFVTTFQDYHPTIAFYNRLGFVEDTRYDEVIGGLLVRHVRLRLDLLSWPT